MDIKKILAPCLFLVCAFPYISLIDTPFDTQPYAVILAGLIVSLVFLKERKVTVSRYILWYGTFAIYAGLLFIISYISIDGARSLVGYLSVFIIAFGSYLTFKYLKVNTLNLAIMMWFVFGILQLVVNKELGSAILPRLSTSESRGITSLAVEPSYYAIICLFLLLYNEYFKVVGDSTKGQYRLNHLMLLFQIIVSQAAIGILLYVVYLVLKSVSKANIGKAILSITSVISLIYISVLVVLNNQSLTNTRAGSLIYAVTHSPMQIINSDGSITDRLAHILISSISLFHNYGLGFGFGTWTEKAFDEIGKNYSFIIELSSVNLTLGGRIMSGWGTVIYELGVIGIFFILLYIAIARRAIKSVEGETKNFIFYSSITIFVIMINAVPISFPLFGYSIGVLAYIGNLRCQKKTSQ